MANNTMAVYLKRPTTYIPYLFAPLAIVALYIYFIFYVKDSNEAPSDVIPTTLECIGPFLIGATTAVYWFKCVITRNLTYVILLAFAACLFLRELHWKPELESDIDIKEAIFPLLGLCAFWFIAWRKIIDKPADNFRHTFFFIPALVTFAFGQAVEKRMFRFMPHEQLMHTWFEESIECCAHTLILLAAIFSSWKKHDVPANPTQPGNSKS